MKNELLYVLYARKSSEAKEKQVASIEDQISECKDYSLRESLNIVFYLEESKSAYKPGIRVEFQRMLELIRSGEANSIITWKPDRLCRNHREGGELLQLLQDGILKEIRTPNGEIYTPESDHFILLIHFGMSNQYSRNLSQNVKRGLKHKCNRGEYPGNGLVGYRQEGDKGKKNLVPNKFEAPIIKKMFELARTGTYSYQRLAVWSFEQGLKGRRSGKQSSKAQVGRIMKQPAYYGYFVRNGEMFSGSYVPLITKDLFEAAQKGLRDRSKPRINTWNNSSYNGLVKCPDCGCAITMSVKTKFYKGTNRTAEYYYLHCTKRKGHCSQKPVTLKEFEEIIVDKVSGIVIDEENWKLGMKLLKAKHREEVERNTNLLSNLQKDYKNCQNKLNRLTEMRMDGELSRDEYLNQKQLVLKSQASVEGLLRDNKDSSENWLELTEKYLDTAFYARSVMESGEHVEKKNLLIDIGENLILNNGKLEFSFKKPYDLLLLPEYRTSVRG